MILVSSGTEKSHCSMGETQAGCFKWEHVATGQKICQRQAHRAYMTISCKQVRVKAFVLQWPAIYKYFSHTWKGPCHWIFQALSWATYYSRHICLLHSERQMVLSLRPTKSRTLLIHIPLLAIKLTTRSVGWRCMYNFRRGNPMRVSRSTIT